MRRTLWAHAEPVMPRQSEDAPCHRGMRLWVLRLWARCMAATRICKGVRAESTGTRCRTGRRSDVVLVNFSVENT
ncbi:UNVERIFIED_CONTAM: hypothetical protein Slati_1041100 [Sesamum latifolium]|uniref:Uncharacterized protein n=1 Tax=Sesamum latifolium TaxID=2727402 RepID=A0AAW2XV80_9LAMI